MYSSVNVLDVFPRYDPRALDVTSLPVQFIAGAVEQRAFANMRPSISSLASMVVRSGNLYVGSLTIVDWLRFLGVQS